MPKVKCNNKECKFNDYYGKCRKKNITISYKGCNSFEKNLNYYIHLVWAAFEGKNFITPIELNNDLRIGLYYVMEIYDLDFKNNTWGNDSFITLHKDDLKDGAALDYTDIISIEMNEDKFFYHYEKLMNGELPPYKDDSDNINENINDDENKKTKTNKTKNKTIKKVDCQPYGWLSPTGKFIKADWGKHEGSAINIINKNNFTAEYNDWSMVAKKSGLARDFLIYEKGYALIHNPSLVGGYKVTYSKDLTNEQRDFLYGYFMDMGDAFTAEKYLTA